MEQENEKTILYVEDDAGLARLIQKRLERDGYHVDIARTGPEAMQCIEKKTYDAVILDYNLPGKDGLEILRDISGALAEPPAMVMLTGAGNETVAVDAMKLGASDYMVKDADAGYLNLIASVIERAMERKSLIAAKKHWEAEREQLIVELQEALANVKRLGGLLPICAACKKIRDDQGYWNQVEVFIHEHSEAAFTHSICPDCFTKMYPGLSRKE